MDTWSSRGRPRAREEESRRDIVVLVFNKQSPTGIFDVKPTNVNQTQPPSGASGGRVGRPSPPRDIGNDILSR